MSRRKACGSRLRRLRAFGLDPEDPHKLAKLRELERRSVGGRAAAREGVAFQPETPARFQGRLTVTEGNGPLLWETWRHPGEHTSDRLREWLC